MTLHQITVIPEAIVDIQDAIFKNFASVLITSPKQGIWQINANPTTHKVKMANANHLRLVNENAISKMLISWVYPLFEMRAEGTG